MDDDLKQFGVEYRYAGKSWITTFHAEDLEDAKRKFHAMTLNGEVQGPVYQVSLPGFLPPWLVMPFLGLTCAALNLWGSITGKRRP